MKPVTREPGRAQPPARIWRTPSRGLLAVCLLSSCATPPPAPTAAPLSRVQPQSLAMPASAASPRISGQLGSGPALPPPTASYGSSAGLGPPTAATATAPGTISLNFADTDIRTVAEQILGTILHLNYTIDPDVQGHASLRTIVPLSRQALIPTLQILLAQNNAVLTQANGLYRVVASQSVAASPELAANATLGGAVVLPLHYAQATSLASMLQPYVTANARIVVAADDNALIVSGDAASRQALVNLIEAFDVDQLAGQSYELFPVAAGNAKDFASAFAAALNRTSDPSQAGPIKIVPLARIDAVLVITQEETLLADAQRVYAVLAQAERENLRSWHVYYLHNMRANDAAYLLQQAFTPETVTAQPTAQATAQASSALNNQSSNGATSDARGLGSNTSDGSGGAGGTNTANDGATAAGTSTGQNASSGASALLGPLSASASTSTNRTIRIIPDNANNAVLIYSTETEDDRIRAMLDNIDTTPTEVRIDATIAEVDLTGALQYGTQFFFKSGGINAVLSEGTTAALQTNFPGFVLSGHGSDAAPLAISLLQSVTKVDILSSPELMVLDGQSAKLQAGDLVPYLTQTSQSTDQTGAPVINSIDYRETGVILQVTPHVGADGLVTLDISQEVSAVQPTVTTTGINSPTFSDRLVTSRVAIQDGQTVGLAGLISDSESRQNEGIPYLKNVPLLGALASTQNNQRKRTELLVLITPHVVRTQSGVASLTADLRAALPNAASLPASLPPPPAPDTSDPNAKLRAKIPQ